MELLHFSLETTFDWKGRTFPFFLSGEQFWYSSQENSKGKHIVVRCIDSCTFYVFVHFLLYMMESTYCSTTLYFFKTFDACVSFIFSICKWYTLVCSIYFYFLFDKTLLKNALWRNSFCNCIFFHALHNSFLNHNFFSKYGLHFIFWPTTGHI